MMKIKAKSKTVSVMLPLDVINFYKELSKLTKVSVNKLINIAIAAALIKERE